MENATVNMHWAPVHKALYIWGQKVHRSSHHYLFSPIITRAWVQQNHSNSLDLYQVSPWATKTRSGMFYLNVKKGETEINWDSLFPISVVCYLYPTSYSSYWELGVGDLTCQTCHCILVSFGISECSSCPLLKGKQRK